MKISKFCLPLAISLACLVVFSFASTASAKSAEWEITTSVEIPGMPFAMPPNTFRHCLDDNAVPYQQSEDQKCETISKKVSGDTVTWKISCQGEGGPTELDGVTKYTGSSMDSKVKMVSNGQQMNMHMSGKKLGACK